MRRVAWLIGSALGLSAVCAAPGWAQELYNFGGYASDGMFPDSGVTADTSGNLYGTTRSGGTAGMGIAYKLTRPAPGTSAWTEQVLWNFGGVTGDGVQPVGDLLLDASGAVYGITPFGGASNAGTVYRLTPPAVGGGAWTETILLSFDKTDGLEPLAGLIEDSAGALYGTAGAGGTNNTGVVFKLLPPTGGQTAWTEQVLYNFGVEFSSGTDGFNPESKLVMDRAGDLFGTTYNGGTSNGTFNDGTVFELSPPQAGQTAWTEQLIYQFNGAVSGAHPDAGLAISGRNVLYGTTSVGGASNDGTVFALAPPTGGPAWRFDLLHSFTGVPDGSSPVAAVKLDSAGNVYGTPNLGGPAVSGFGQGTVFQLTPPSKPTGIWVERLYSPVVEAGGFNQDVLPGPGHVLYGVSAGGPYGGGTVFRLPEDMLQ